MTLFLRGEQMNCTVIGIAGGTGSGKSTFTNRLKDAFGDQISVLYHDNYYKAQDDIIKKIINMCNNLVLYKSSFLKKFSMKNYKKLEN